MSNFVAPPQLVENVPYQDVGLTMLSKRIQTRLLLLNIALVAALVGLTATAGVPPARFPLKFRIVESVIFLCFLLSLLYQVMAQLPPIRFRIKTIMILVAVVAIELTYCRMLIQVLGLKDGAQFFVYILALIYTPGIVRAWTQGPERRPSPNEDKP